jgi:hypothetical protein
VIGIGLLKKKEEEKKNEDASQSRFKSVISVFDKGDCTKL